MNIARTNPTPCSAECHHFCIEASDGDICCNCRTLRSSTTSIASYQLPIIKKVKVAA